MRCSKTEGKGGQISGGECWLWARSGLQHQIRAGLLPVASWSPRFSSTCMRVPLTCIPNANLPVNPNRPLSCTFQPKPFLKCGFLCSQHWKAEKDCQEFSYHQPYQALHFTQAYITKLGRGGRDPSVKCSQAKEPTGRKQGLHPLEDKPYNLCINYSSFTFLILYFLLPNGFWTKAWAFIQTS